MPRLPHLTAALAAAAALSGACGDDVVGPETPEVVPPLAVSAEEREQMRIALLFAGEHSTAALQSGGASQVAAAFASLARAAERNDRLGVERGIASARTAIRQYRTARPDHAADPDLEAMTLTLDQVAMRATVSLSPEEHQP